ncbi:hypothetical protein [Pedobacter sp. MW01-1-1]|uniref:hypothetical protein n=1 Tax=Pedobacter sp. MW01-1-1 TaxID=3383027 RepID=UPI003FEF926A
MAGEGGNIVRNVFGKSYKEAESIMKDASNGPLDFKSPHENTFYGKKGGKKFDEYQAKKETQSLLVKEVKCYEDFACTKEVKIIKKEVKYYFKATQYSRTPSKAELKTLKWAIQYDGNPLVNAPQVTGEEKISFAVPEERKISTLRVYAFFKGPLKNVSAQADLKNGSYIIVIGTQSHSSSQARNWLLQDVGPGSKLMFVHQGLRRMRLNPHIKFEYLLCIRDYSSAQRNAIKEAVENKFKGKYVEVSSAQDVINYINNDTNRNLRPIKQLIFYSHGVVGEISLGLAPAGMDITAYSFEKEEVAKLKKESFSDEANIYLFSCRSGIGNSNISRTIYINPKGSKTDANNRYNILSTESIAQKFANSTKATVHAYLRRTDYEETLFTTDELCFSDYMKIRQGNNSIKPSNKCSRYSYLLDKKYKLNSAETKRWEDWKAIESNMKNIDDAWFDPDGARNNVKAAPSPEGVPGDMKTFKPL